MHHHPSRALGYLTGIKSTTAGSMERRSGSVISAQNGVLFNQIGRLTRRYVAHANIAVIVALFFHGKALRVPWYEL